MKKNTQPKNVTGNVTSHNILREGERIVALCHVISINYIVSDSFVTSPFTTSSDKHKYRTCLIIILLSSHCKEKQLIRKLKRFTS